MSKNYYDSSKLKAYEECPRKFYWRYVRNLVQKDYAPAPLNYGTAIHEALYTWYTRHTEGLSDEEAIEAAIEIFHGIWKERPNDTKRTHEKGERLLRGYFERYPSENWTFLTPPETAFKIDLMGFDYVGRFDGVIEWNDMMLVLDHKTSSRMGRNYYKRYRPDIQMTGYTWAAEQLLDRVCDGVLVNVLYFTTTKIRYEREIISRERWELEQFVDIVTNLMNEIDANDPDNIHDWQPRWTNCMRWGVCPYRDLCLSQEPEKLVDLMFREEIWDPLEDPIERAKRQDEKAGERLRLSL